MVSQFSSPLSRSMETVAGSLDGPIDVNELLHLICRAAIDNVRGADYSGITLADRHGKLETPAATHPLVHQVDALQYQYRQGPCVDAVQGRWQARSDNLRVDIRWPEYGPLAAELGIHSQMGIELFDEPGLIAGLNLYSPFAGAFDDDTVEAAMLFAIQATHTLGRVMTQKQLTDAMTTSTTIGRATGVVMHQFQLTGSSIRTPHPRLTDLRRDTRGSRRPDPRRAHEPAHPDRRRADRIVAIAESSGLRTSAADHHRPGSRPPAAVDAHVRNGMCRRIARGCQNLSNTDSEFCSPPTRRAVSQ